MHVELPSPVGARVARWAERNDITMDRVCMIAMFHECGNEAGMVIMFEARLIIGSRRVLKIGIATDIFSSFRMWNMP